MKKGISANKRQVDNDSTTTRSKKSAIAGSSQKPQPGTLLFSTSGIDLVSLLKREPIVHMLQFLTDDDLIAFAQTHPKHRAISEIVARNRLLHRMSIEAIEQYCMSKGVTPIGILSQAKIFRHSSFEHIITLICRSSGIFREPSDAQVAIRNIFEDLFQGKLDSLFELNKKMFSSSLDIIITSFIAQAVCYGHFNLLNDPRVQSLKGSILKAAFVCACYFGHDVIAAQFIKYKDIVYDRNLFSDYLNQSFKITNYSVFALLLIMHFTTIRFPGNDYLQTEFSGKVSLFQLRNRNEPTLPHFAEQFYSFCVSHMSLLKDQLPKETLPEEVLIFVALLLGLVDKAKSLTEEVMAIHGKDVRILFKHAFDEACANQDIELAQMIIFETTREPWPNQHLVVFELQRLLTAIDELKLDEVRLANVHQALISKAEKTNSLGQLFLALLKDRNKPLANKYLLLDMILANYFKRIQPHLIELGIYMAINLNNYSDLRFLLHYATPHMSAVAFDEFIEFAKDNTTKDILKLFKSNNQEQAIPHTYAPYQPRTRKR